MLNGSASGTGERNMSRLHLSHENQAIAHLPHEKSPRPGASQRTAIGAPPRPNAQSLRCRDARARLITAPFAHRRMCHRRLQVPSACSRSSAPPRSSASRPCSSRSKSTCRSACPTSPSSACPTRACARAAIACAPRSATRASTTRRTRVTVNLAPADLRKVGSAFDLPIAHRRFSPPSGELVPRVPRRCAAASASCRSTARIQPIRGVLPAVVAARRVAAFAACCCRPPTPPKRRSCPARAILAARHARPKRSTLLRDPARRRRRTPRAAPDAGADGADRSISPTSRGQPLARRALEIAAAGGHHLLLCGPPGCGKTMLARRLPGLLPDSDVRRRDRGLRDALGRPVSWPAAGLMLEPPFRAPHHTISDVALVGGGAHAASRRDQPRASRRALPRRAAGVQPARARSAAPADRSGLRHRLARGADGALPRPLPAGRGDEPVSVRLRSAIRGAPAAARRCQVQRYASRISGPLRDRIDLTRGRAAARRSPS